MQCCAMITTINFKMVLVLQKETPYLLVVTTDSPTGPPSPWQPLIYFVSLWICLLWTFSLNGITQFLIFYDFLFSLNIEFMHIIACINI